MDEAIREELSVRKVLSKVCKNCGTRFETSVPGKQFCCNRCQWTHGSRKRVKIRECPVCWKIIRSGGNKTYCSKECREKAKVILPPRKKRGTYKDTAPWVNNNGLTDDTKMAKAMGVSYGTFMAMKEGRG